MSDDTQAREPEGTGVAPGVAGASSGTLLVLVSYVFPGLSEDVKSVLVLAAPTCAVGFSAVWSAAIAWIRRYRREKALKGAAAMAKQALKDDPDMSRVNRARIREIYEKATYEAIKNRLGNWQSGTRDDRAVGSLHQAISNRPPSRTSD